MKFKSDIEVQAGLKDSSGALGGSGQILSSTSGNVSWVTPTINTVARDVQNEVKAGVAINKGQAVYVTGADGTNIIVGLASNATEATSSKTLGLLNATVAINGFADVVQIGRLAGLDTSAANQAGDPVWLGTGGNLIYGLINKPYAPANLVFIGVVTRKNVSNGEIFISVQNGFELNELHDVDLKTTIPVNGDILGFNGTLWVNKTIAGWLGYTPANASGTVNYVSKFTGATTLGNSQIFDNGTNVGINTSSPTEKLSVSGTIRAFGAGNAGRITSVDTQAGGATIAFNPQFSTGVPGIETIGAFPIAFYTNSSEKMRITSSGDAGIGTTAPAAKLNVIGDLHLGNYSNLSTVNFENRTNKAVFSISTNGVTNAVGTTITYSWADGGQGPLKFNNAGGEVMRLTSVGNLGIGTTSPSEKFDVLGVIRNVLTDTLGLGGITAKFLSYLTSPYGIIFRGNSTGSHSIQVQREANDAEVFPLLLQPNGSNVKIGGPDAPDLSSILDVQSTTKGFLPPRLTNAERDAIPDPAAGLIIFNKDNETIDVYTTGGWKSTILL